MFKKFDVEELGLILMFVVLLVVVPIYGMIQISNVVHDNNINEKRQIEINFEIEKMKIEAEKEIAQKCYVDTPTEESDNDKSESSTKL